MALNQLSVFVDNTPGALADIAEVLANADINLRALSIADTERFGILPEMVLYVSLYLLLSAAFHALARVRLSGSE